MNLRLPLFRGCSLWSVLSRVVGHEARGLTAACLAVVSAGTVPAQPASLPPAGTMGTLVAHAVTLEAPDAAVQAYLAAFGTRTWELRVASRGDFIAQLFALDLSPATRDALAAPELWRGAATADPERFLLHPPVALLASLSADERRSLYHLLAGWPDNKPERWPLVFRDAARLRALHEQGVPVALLDRVAALSYPFAGGLAFSDFAVIAAEFPDPAGLARFLQLASRVDAVIPRLRLSTVRSVSESLAYWTVNYQNPFALPLLEALAESETAEGTELESILPGIVRNRLFDLDPAEVSHDIAINSFAIAASLAAPPADPRDPARFFAWFEETFAPVPPPFRFGDVLVLQSTDGDTPVSYACAFINDDLVFAKDPTGLGLWRFQSLTELRQRNPHFASADFVAWRRISRP